MPADEPDAQEPFDGLSREDAIALRGLLKDLIHMDRIAKREGHSLVELLALVARDKFGIDIRPSHDAKEIQRREY